MYSLTWLPKVLTDAGLIVHEQLGWQNRGHGDFGKPLGVLCHHTCGALHGEMPSLGVLIHGRPDLSGPLSQLGLGRSGEYYIVCAGLGYHAGPPGKDTHGNNLWPEIPGGNSHLIGIEAENVGVIGQDPWPAVQMDAYKRGSAAILKHIGQPASRCIGHKEWAPHRKDDPDFDMVSFRADVAKIMNPTIPTS